jgi:hypothetical protein
VKKFKCPICASKFWNQNSLDVHNDCVHEKVKKCVCDVCGKWFSNVKTFKLHAKKHEGEKSQKNIKKEFNK